MTLALIIGAVFVAMALQSESAQAHHAVQVSAGGSHSCAVTTGGSVECWGENYDGRADAPSGRFSQVSAGGSHSCAVTTGGSVECWGENYDGRADAPSGRFSQVSAGGSHSCAVTTGGSVECWGQNNYGQADAPSGRFSQVSAGSAHSCAVTTGGSVECWGQNNYGQADAPSGRFSQVSAGFAHSCAVTTGGSVECWDQDKLYGSNFADEHEREPQLNSLTAKIVARPDSEGWLSLELALGDDELFVPRVHRFPPNPRRNRWLSTSEISAYGLSLGRIQARRLTDGRTEIRFSTSGTTDGENIEPELRFLRPVATLPVGQPVWLSEIEIPLDGCRLSDPIENGIIFPTRRVQIDDSERKFTVAGLSAQGGGARYRVCVNESQMSGVDYDRALFTAGYYYSTDPEVDPLYSTVVQGLADAETGYQAYLDHFNTQKLVNGFRTLTNIAYAVVSFGYDSTTTVEVVAHHETLVGQAGEIAAQALPRLQEVAKDLAPWLILDWSQETLDAALQQPDEFVKELSWNYVMNARAWGIPWQNSVDQGREGETVRRIDTSRPTNPPTYRFVVEHEVLSYDAAKLLRQVELDIARGVVGLELNRVLKVEEAAMWKRAFENTLPIWRNIRTLYDSYGNIYEALDQALFNNLSEQLRSYPPYNRMLQALEDVSQIVSTRQQDLIDRLGIHASSIE